MQIKSKRVQGRLDRQDDILSLKKSSQVSSTVGPTRPMSTRPIQNHSAHSPDTRLMTDSQPAVLVCAVMKHSEATSTSSMIGRQKWNFLSTPTRLNSSACAKIETNSTLAAPASAERRHVAVGEKSVHVENEAGELGCYDLSDLRAVHSTSEFLVADFGQKRYVYVPRSALSENRYRDLVRFLNEKSR